MWFFSDIKFRGFLSDWFNGYLLDAYNNLANQLIKFEISTEGGSFVYVYHVWEIGRIDVTLRWEMASMNKGLLILTKYPL